MTATVESDLQVNVEMIEIDVLKPSKTNPRKVYEREALNKLAASIREHGVLQPLVVRVHSDNADCFEIIAGERRYRATKKTKRKLIPCRIIECDDVQAIEIQASENLDRVDLNPIEEAQTWKNLLEATGLTQAKLAKRYNRKQSDISNSVRLLNLPKVWQKKLINREIPFTFARDLVGWIDDKNIAYWVDYFWDFHKQQLAPGQLFDLADLRNILAESISKVSMHIDIAAPLGELTPELREKLKVKKLPKTLFGPDVERIFCDKFDLNELLEEVEAEDQPAEDQPADKKQSELELATEEAEELDQADQAAKDRIEEREERIQSEKTPEEVQANIDHAQEVADRNKGSKFDSPGLRKKYAPYKREWIDKQVNDWIEKHSLSALAAALGVSVSNDWKLDETFLKLHDKKQLLSLAREWGFDVNDLQEYESEQSIIEAMLVMDRQGRLGFDADESYEPAQPPLALIRCDIEQYQ